MKKRDTRPTHPPPLYTLFICHRDDFELLVALAIAIAIKPRVRQIIVMVHLRQGQVPSAPVVLLPVVHPRGDGDADQGHQRHHGRDDNGHDRHVGRARARQLLAFQVLVLNSSRAKVTGDLAVAVCGGG